MTIDPTIAMMMSKLAELTLPNATAAIYTKIQAITAGKIDQKTVNELREIIDTLLAERNDLVAIARAYEEQLVSQRISDEDISYIIDTVIPALKDMVAKSATSDPAVAMKMNESIDLMTSLLSAEMLTVLQLVGFNFKKAIGEPLTVLVEKLITSQIRPDQQSILDINRLNAEGNVEMLKIAQDNEASQRLQRLVAIWRGSGTNP